MVIILIKTEVFVMEMFVLFKPAMLQSLMKLSLLLLLSSLMLIYHQRFMII